MRTRSLRAAARARYRQQAAQDEKTSPRRSPSACVHPPHHFTGGGKEHAAAAEPASHFGTAVNEPAVASALPLKDSLRGAWAQTSETALMRQARTLYEDGVVPIRDLAQLVGVSVRTLYHHVHKRGWRRRRSAVPRDPAKSERQRRRYQARKAMRPPRPNGLRARDPDGAAVAEAVCREAADHASAALSQASAEAAARRALRVLDLLEGALGDFARLRNALAKQGGRPAAERLALTLLHLILRQCGRLVARP